MGHTSRLHRLHGLDPAHGGGSLAYQGILDSLGITQLGDIHIIHYRDLRYRKLQIRQPDLKFFCCGQHQRAMERRRNRQHQGAFCTLGLGSLGRTLNSRLMAGNHRLFGLIEIHRLHDLSLGRLSAGLNDRRRIQAENGCHRPCAGRHRVLHGAGAQLNQRHGILERQHAGGDQRRILTQAMASHQRRLRAAVFQPQPINGNAGSQHQGLGVDCLVQCLGRAFADQLPEVAAQCRRSLIKSGAHNGRITILGHHAQ